MQRSGQVADREKIQEAGRVKEACSKRSDENKQSRSQQDKHTEKPLRDLDRGKTILCNEREEVQGLYRVCDQCNQCNE